MEPSRKMRCPFCNHNGAVLCTVRELNRPQCHFMICPDCQACGPRMMTGSGAVRSWKRLLETLRRAERRN